MKILLCFVFAAAISLSHGAEPPSTKHPSFRLDSKARRLLVQKAVALRPGESYQAVTNKLGSPTYDQVLAKKESNRIIGRSLKYYVVRWEAGLVDELSDQLVDVLLDVHDRVRSVSIRLTLTNEADG